MRQLLCCLLILTLIFPWEARAQLFGSSSSTNTSDPNHPAFAALKSKVQQADSAGIDVPENDPIANSTTTKNITFHDLSDAQSLQSSGILATGCNPVVWAYMVQKARQRTVKDVTTAVGAHDQLNKAASNKCITNVGPNGENLDTVNQDVKNSAEQLQQQIEQTICSLNWSALLHALVGGSLSFCKGGQLFGGTVNTSLQNSFLINGTDPTKSKNCIQSAQVNQNLITQTAGSYGTNALNGSSSSNIRFDSTGTSPSGAGPGFTINFSGSGGVGNNGASSSTGVSINGTGVNASTGSSNSVTAPPAVTNPANAAQNIYK